MKKGEGKMGKGKWGRKGWEDRESRRGEGEK
jgi:hypothetical protein